MIGRARIPALKQARRLDPFPGIDDVLPQRHDVQNHPQNRCAGEGWIGAAHLESWNGYLDLAPALRERLKCKFALHIGRRFTCLLTVVKQLDVHARRNTTLRVNNCAANGTVLS